MARYHLTEDQMQKLRDQGMNGAEIIRAAQAAETSKKPIAEIMQMRQYRGLTWSMIADELGIPPNVTEEAVLKLTESVNPKPVTHRLVRAPATARAGRLGHHHARARSTAFRNPF